MADDSGIRYYHRHIPWDRICAWLSCAVIVALLAIYLGAKLGAWDDAALLFAAAGCLAARVGFFRELFFVVNDQGLLVIKRSLMRLYGAYDFFPASEIRVVRYRSDTYQPEDGDGPAKTRYILDLTTNSARIVTLITSSEFPLPRKLGRELASAGRVPL